MKPILLTICVVGNPEPIKEANNYLGYIPRQGEVIRIDSAAYRVVEIQYNYHEVFHFIDAVELTTVLIYHERSGT